MEPDGSLPCSHQPALSTNDTVLK